MARRIIPFLVVAIVVILTGCGSPVEAFDLVIESPEGSREVELRDILRRSPEEEALVSATMEEAPRFRVDGWSDVVQAVPVRGVLLTVEGSTAGATLEVRDGSGDRSGSTGPVRRWSLDVPVPGSAGEGDSPRTVSLYLHGAIPSDAEDLELHFIPPRRGSYRILRIVLLSDPPEPVVMIPGVSGEVRYDTRLPLTWTGTAWELDAADRLVDSPGGALRFAYHAEESLFSERTRRPTLDLVLEGADGERRAFEWFLRPGAHDLVIRPDLWGVVPRRIVVDGIADGVELRQISGVAAPPGPRDPISVELRELQDYPAERWRRADFELFSWSIYPEILWFDTIDYETQSRLFRRLTFFVEKRGFIGRLLTDEELEGRHDWNAHNYRPEGLSDFYNAVAATSFPLNDLEEELREILLHNGVLIAADDGTYLPGRGGILGISQESFPELRHLLTVHEAMHGVFYEEQSFRRAAFDYWDVTLGTREKSFWREFLGWMSYAPEDRYLMVNEMQAYLLQQSEPAVRWYFRTRVAGRLRNAYPARTEAIDLFMRDYPTTFVDAGAAMNAALFTASGMVGGDPYCLRALPPADTE
jgi:hypothetical protein